MKHGFRNPFINELFLPDSDVAVLCGKGPSLDAWEIPDCDIIMTINDALLVVPQATIGFAVDPPAWDLISEELAERGLPCVVSYRIPLARDISGNRKTHIFWQSGKATEDSSYLWSSGGSGTSAVDLLARRGVKKILCAGFDAARGVDGYVQGVKSSPNKDAFERAKNTWNMMNVVAKHHGVELELI